MPSKMTAIVFALGVIAAAVAMWALADHSVAKAIVFLLAMLFGGSIYFLLGAQEQSGSHKRQRRSATDSPMDS